MVTQHLSLKGVIAVSIAVFLSLILSLLHVSAYSSIPGQVQAPTWEQIIYAQGAGFEYSASQWWRAIENPTCALISANAITTQTRIPPNTNDVDWARWWGNFPAIDQYDVYVYIPGFIPYNNSITQQARYQIVHSGGTTVQVVNQAANGCQWIYLGRYVFGAGASGYVYLGDYTGEGSPLRWLGVDAVKFVQVPPVPPTVFAGNVSSRLFFDNNGNRINLEICANNLPGQTVNAQLSHPNHTFDVMSQPASGRCVVFWDMHPVGAVLENTNYTTRAALNQNPDINWPGNACFAATGGQGLCDTQSSSGGTTGYKLPYPGGVSHRLGRNRHGNTPAYDFGLPLNGSVVATRSGLVTRVKENSSSYGCSSTYTNQGNYIEVRHSDGSVAWYYHLRKNGAIVTVGEQVQRGQLLGYTGNSGYMCGAHLHFEVRSGGIRKIVQFEDTGNHEPAANTWYTSGNYMGSLKINEPQLQLADLLPEGRVQFRLNQSPSSNEIKLFAYDYTEVVTEMRVASSEADLQNASWIPYSDTMSWSSPSVFVEYRTADGRVSTIYSDTIASTANDVITADFQLESTEVCVGKNVSISNFTVPYCPQCSWEWDLGNGLTTQSFNPASDENGAWWEYDFMESYFDPNLSYSTPGVYEITVSVENASHSSTVIRQVTVIGSISADFSITRVGNTVTVTAVENNAVSWEWEFSDGGTATGQTVSHTFASLEQPQSIVLSVQATNGCTGEMYQFVQDYHMYLPFVDK